MLFLDGVYFERRGGLAEFRPVRAPSSAKLLQLTQTSAQRIGRYLEREGQMLEPDPGNAYLASDEAGTKGSGSFLVKCSKVIRERGQPLV